jgi:hypothetical protein
MASLGKAVEASGSREELGAVKILGIIRVGGHVAATNCRNSY